MKSSVFSFPYLQRLNPMLIHEGHAATAAFVRARKRRGCRRMSGLLVK